MVRGEGDERRGVGRKREGGAGVGYSSNLISFCCGTDCDGVIIITS